MQSKWSTVGPALCLWTSNGGALKWTISRRSFWTISVPSTTYVIIRPQNAYLKNLPIYGQLLEHNALLFDTSSYQKLTLTSITWLKTNFVSSCFQTIIRLNIQFANVFLVIAGVIFYEWYSCCI